MRLIGILCMSSEAECITSRAPERQADKHGGATPVYYTSRSVGVKGGGGGEEEIKAKARLTQEVDDSRALRGLRGQGVELQIKYEEKKFAVFIYI